MNIIYIYIYIYILYIYIYIYMNFIYIYIYMYYIYIYIYMNIIYIHQQLCEDTGCCPDDLPRAMNDREEWRESVRDIRATSVT